MNNILILASNRLFELIFQTIIWLVTFISKIYLTLFC